MEPYETRHGVDVIHPLLKHQITMPLRLPPNGGPEAGPVTIRTQDGSDQEEKFQMIMI